MSKDVKRMSLKEAEYRLPATRSPVQSTAVGVAEHTALTLSIFHLKNLAPIATEHITTLYNDFLKSFRLPSIWKT